MIDVGLRPEERKALRSTLRDSHRRRITVTLRNGNEDPISSLTTPIARGITDGQIMGDATQDVTRSLSLSVLDPEGRLRFERDSPAEGAVFANRFVSVEYGVLVPQLDDWVDVPVFWGVITDFARRGHTVQLEAQGKEALMLAPHYATESYTIPRDMRLDDAIRRVARRAGERRFNLPTMSRKLRNPRTVTAESEPWKVIAGGEKNVNGRRIAGLVERGSGNKVAFYDGRGRLTVRGRNQNPVLTIRHDRDIVGESGLNFDVLDAVNTVIVRGAEPQGKGKRRAMGKATLPIEHSISPRKLAWNGEPRYMTMFVDTELETDSLCRDRAWEVLRRRSHQMVEAELQVLPIPMVEEWDVIRFTTPEWDFEFPLKFWTLPLGPGQAMTLATRRRADRPRWRRPYFAVTARGISGTGRVPKKTKKTKKAKAVSVSGKSGKGRA